MRWLGAGRWAEMLLTPWWAPQRNWAQWARGRAGRLCQWSIMRCGESTENCKHNNKDRTIASGKMWLVGWAGFMEQLLQGFMQKAISIYFSVWTLTFQTINLSRYSSMTFEHKLFFWIFLSFSCFWWFIGSNCHCCQPGKARANEVGDHKCFKDTDEEHYVEEADAQKASG